MNDVCCSIFPSSRRLGTFLVKWDFSGPYSVSMGKQGLLGANKKLCIYLKRKVCHVVWLFFLLTEL